MVIQLIAAIVGVVLIPWIKSKYTASQINNAMTWVRIAVQAAEQLYNSEQGDAKKAYVMRFLNGKGITLNSDEIDKAIEAAVLELHSELYKDSKGVAE